MTAASLTFGQNCPCGVGTVTGVSERHVYAGQLLAAHMHTHAEIETLLRKQRNAWADRKHWPHECPRCGAPAYVGAVPAAVDCRGGCK